MFENRVLTSRTKQNPKILPKAVSLVFDVWVEGKGMVEKVIPLREAMVEILRQNYMRLEKIEWEDGTRSWAVWSLLKPWKEFRGTIFINSATGGNMVWADWDYEGDDDGSA